MEVINKTKADIFAYIFKLSNSLQVYLDRALEDDHLTAKQFFLMIVIDSCGDNSPTFKQAAIKSGSSYQNIKQLALKLEKNGYVKIDNDKNDKRAKRLRLTQKCKEYWSKRDASDIDSLNSLFEDFSSDQLNDFFSYICKMTEGIKKIEKK